jgi:hypothetical protein
MKIDALYSQIYLQPLSVSISLMSLSLGTILQAVN